MKIRKHTRPPARPLHPFAADPTIDPDPSGARVCARCGKLGRDGDAQHPPIPPPAPESTGPPRLTIGADPGLTLPPGLQVAVATTEGTTTTVGEPVCAHLAITPAWQIYSTPGGGDHVMLTGTWHITHRATGTHVTITPGCISCARAAGRDLSHLPGWENVTPDTIHAWARNTLTERQRLVLHSSKDLAWHCRNADPCPRSINPEVSPYG